MEKNETELTNTAKPAENESGDVSLMRTLGLALAVCTFLTPTAQAIVAGQIDNFEDGTTQGWGAAFLGAPHPSPPANIATGGPGGINDNFLRIQSFGPTQSPPPDPGRRLVAGNFSQWTGNYATSGISAISMDVKNFGTTNLALRLYFENPIMGPPVDTALTDTAIIVPAGADWTRIAFAVSPDHLVAVTGDIPTLLANMTFLRLIHAPTTGPATTLGGLSPGIVAELGVDNIQAHVPEPASMGLLVAGLAGLGLLRGRRKSRHG